MKLHFFTIVFAIQLIAAVIDPVGLLYGLRYVALSLTLAAAIFSLISRVASGKSIDNIIFLFLIPFCIVLPLSGSVIWALRGHSPYFGLDTSYFAAAFVCPLCLLFETRNIADNLLRVYVLVLRVFALFFVSTYLFTSISGNQAFAYQLIERGILLLGVREYSNIESPYFYFISAPLFVPLLCYETYQVLVAGKRRSLPWLAVVLLALFSNGARAIWLSCILSLVATPVLIRNKKQNLGKFAGAATILILLILLLQFVDIERIYNYLSSLLSFSDVSTSSKLKSSGVYLDLIFSDFSVLLFGQGFNAYEWSLPLQQILADGASRSELTYHELFRTFGIPFSLYTLFNLSLILLRSKLLALSNKWLWFGTILILLMSAQNPYLFSTNGFIPLSMLVGCISVVGIKRQTVSV